MNRAARVLALFCLAFAATATAVAQVPPWRDSAPEERRRDAAAFDGFDATIGERHTDVQSLVVVMKGRTLYQYYRDGNPDALRDVQSVTKSALAMLVGTLLQSGQLPALETPVVQLVPEWRELNADPRTHTITLDHLLSMTPGFGAPDASGTGAPKSPRVAWARPLEAAPGQRFAYDNSVPVMLFAVLERASGKTLAQLANEQLAAPLDMLAPAYDRGMVQMRTIDMAKLGHLMLAGGRWGERELMPTGFAARIASRSTAGGPPVGLPYGLGWWVASPDTYFASGYGGQMIWVHAPLGLVVAVTSTVSPESMRRGQALQLVRGRVFEAVNRRRAMGD